MLKANATLEVAIVAPLVGPLSMVSVGGVASTVKLRLVVPRLPAASVEVAKKVCAPSAKVEEAVVVQVEVASASNEHSVLAAVSLLLKEIVMGELEA